MRAVYMGVLGGSRALRSERDSFLHCFFADGDMMYYLVSAKDDYALQNTLEISRVYDLTVVDDVVLSARLCGQTGKPPVAPVRCTPGLRTLKNLLATAFAPVGGALYVYGGGWNWQDTGAGPQATTIGAAASWGDFFRAQDSTYAYRSDANPSGGFYPFGGWNPYYFAGLDCSGYIGWTVYNTLHDHSGLPGYVCSAVNMAEDCFNRGWGPILRERPPAGSLRPGDICSTASHVWLCLGLCEDGSVLLAHSTPSESRAGYLGGGAQLSALGSDQSCHAYRLAETYMTRYYPAWASRYLPVLKSYEAYTDFSSGGGWFRWATDGSGVLTDPDGFASIPADALLQRLFEK